MAAIVNASARLALACILLAAGGACGAAGDTPPEATATQEVDTLPLQRGYYVSTDTPCEKASNATLHLMRRDGDGYGGFTTPPYACTFKRIERTGPSTYRVTEECGSAHGGHGDPETSVSVYDISSDTSYRATREDGWESSARRCPRRQLPPLWRESGIGDFVD